MRRIKILRVLACLFTFSVSLLVCRPLSHAAEKAADISEPIVTSESPIHITSDRMEAKQDQRIIDFDGNVAVQQDDLNITSNHLKVVLLPEGDAEKAPAATASKGKAATASKGKAPVPAASSASKGKAPASDAPTALIGKAPAPGESGASQRIDYIVFEGSVKLVQRDRLATADKAIYYQKEQKITMHGKPVVTQGEDRVEGDLITIYIQENRSVVESGSGTPVHAVLFPKKD